MIIDKLESYTLHIDQANHYLTRRKISKLLEQLKSHLHFSYEFIRLKQAFVLRVQLPKKALPYLISFLSYHNYLFHHIVLTQYEHLLTERTSHAAVEKHFEIAIDGLNDMFIKDKIIDVLNSFKHHNIHYGFSNRTLKLTTTHSIFMLLIQKLAIYHIDIYHASQPIRSYKKRAHSC
ncbi:hypothetical protein [Staphylococcus canis]|uniref:Uncharacterized protein n=1 Tax=Staphylococcus canis TaxID=2724942 RepID=A0ABS0TAR3_9STAP|nr:hypothetical protein [Staphylococcus canis]MBI5975840.1 hypothetical protein [Staphylococcus canis]